MISKYLTRAAVEWAKMLVLCCHKIKHNQQSSSNDISIPWDVITHTLKEPKIEAWLFKEIDSVVSNNADIR